MPKEPSEKIRLQFDLSSRVIRRLDEIKTITDATSRAETVRSALLWYGWLVRLYAGGSTFYVKSKEGEVKEIPFVIGFWVRKD